jgi:hypothetical protein
MLKQAMFAAIKVPEAYLGGGENPEDQTTLTQKEVHFTNTIQRIQRAIIETLEHIAKVHLLVMGFRGDDLLSFKLKFNNPSKIARMQELTAFKEQLDVASAAKGINMFSNRYIYTQIFAIPDEEAKRIERERFYDIQIEAAIQASAQEMGGEGQEGAMGGMGAGGLGGDEMMPSGGDLIGDMSQLSSEPGPSGEGGGSVETGEEPTVDKEAPLLASPGNFQPQAVSQTVERDSDGNIVKIHLGNSHTLTPKSKGKVYKPEIVDSRKNTGPLNRSMKYQMGAGVSSNSNRNINPGTNALKRLSKLQENKDAKSDTIYTDLTNYFNNMETQLEKIDEAKA